MCQYIGIFYEDCTHVRFKLHHFCLDLFHQLQRINNLEERETHALPFDPDTPGCEPYALFDENGLPETRDAPGTGNVLWWVINLSEMCPGCEAGRTG